jgi:hypothetical protein
MVKLIEQPEAKPARSRSRRGGASASAQAAKRARPDDAEA